MEAIRRGVFIFMILLSFSGCREGVENKSFPEFENAYSYICGQHPELSRWITVVDKADVDIYADTKNHCIVFRTDGNTTSIKYSSVKGHYSAKKCTGEDLQKLKEKLENVFKIDSKTAESLYSVDSICNRLNVSVNAKYKQEIDSCSLPWYDKFLSVIYNVCVGDESRHLLAYAKDGKIKYLREASFPKSYIDKEKFKSVIEKEYDKNMHLSSLDSILRAERAIVSYDDFDFKFTYFNVRTDSIYIGGKAYSVKSTDVSSLKDSIVCNPDLIFLVKDNGIVVRLECEVPEFFSMLPCEIEILDERQDADKSPVTGGTAAGKEQESTLLMKLAKIGTCLAILLFFSVLVIVIIRRTKNKRISNQKMNIEKIIDITERLIKLYDDELDSNNESGQHIDELVLQLKTVPDFDDNFKDAGDLRKWLDNFKARHMNEMKELMFSKLSENSSVEDILANFDDVFGTSKSNEYASMAFMQECRILSNNSKDEIEVILSLYDKHSGRTSELKDKYCRIKDKSEEFKKLLEANSEPALIERLASLQEKYTQMPKLYTIAQLYHDAKNSNDPIEFIVKKIESYANDECTLSNAFSELEKSAKDSERTKGLIGLSKDSEIYDYIRNAIDNFINDRQTIEAAVDFVGKFRTNGNGINSLEDILGVYPKVWKIVVELKSLFDVFRKTQIDYWDRLALILLSISKCSLPILKATGNDVFEDKDIDAILLDIKRDLMRAYITRIFCRDVVNREVNVDRFADNLSTALNDAVENYNSRLANDDPLLLISDVQISKFIDEQVEIFKESISKIRGYESTMSFINLMWDNFVEDFLAKARGSRDDAYILGQALNIAYHTTDFLEHVKTGQNVEYCFNFAFLLQNLDPRKAGAKEFIHNDYTKSTSYSNYIYELAERLGIDNLKILIDKYYIKP